MNAEELKEFRLSSARNWLCLYKSAYEGFPLKSTEMEKTLRWSIEILFPSKSAEARAYLENTCRFERRLNRPYLVPTEENEENEESES